MKLYGVCCPNGVFIEFEMSLKEANDVVWGGFSGGKEWEYEKVIREAKQNGWRVVEGKFVAKKTKKKGTNTHEN